MRKYEMYMAKEATYNYTAKQVLSMLPKHMRELFTVGKLLDGSDMDVLIVGHVTDMSWVYPRSSRKQNTVLKIPFSKYNPRRFANNFKGKNLFKVEN